MWEVIILHIEQIKLHMNSKNFFLLTSMTTQNLSSDKSDKRTQNICNVSARRGYINLFFTVRDAGTFMHMLVYSQQMEQVNNNLPSAATQHIQTARRYNWKRNNNYTCHFSEDSIMLMQVSSAILSSPVLFSGSKFFSHLNMTNRRTER
jgi:hypothetical protein